jgi:COX assembly protein 2
MTALEECHARGFLWKSMGMCSAAKTEVNKCLRVARLARTAKNREEAKKKREHIQKVWADIDANS